MQNNSKQLYNFLKNHCIPDGAYNLFVLYEKILRERNKKINLVSERSLENIWLTHFLDSILITDFLDFSNSRVLDFGSGGGFPGIPLKIFYPTMELYCVESIRKKVLFLRLIKQELNLSETNIIHSRFEELDHNIKGSFDYIVVRAVKMNDEYFMKAFELLKPSGKLILYKSALNNNEVDKINYYADCDKTEIIRKEYSGLGKRAFIIVKKHD
ncbi:MAG: 16S rRNA (guanine(527)-N(7))-methyltransferase RsmG [Candidatus Celaenobacter polaris]|nr:16S rRNA (guanine(527)-N(7))-methyltransferase RsmG [Candidatus Celaenobacter polaris]